MLRRRLRELERAGARVFDGPSWGFAAALLERAAARRGAARQRLLARVRTRLEELSERHQAAEQAAQQLLGSSRAQVGDSVHAAMARGDYVAVLRVGRRWQRRPSPTAAAVLRPLIAIPTVAVRRSSSARQTALDNARPGAAASPSAQRRLRAHARVRRHRRLRAELHAALRLAQARDRLPSEVGPYNGEAIAVALLERAAAISPVYADAQLERLRELAALALIPGRNDEARKPKSRRGRGE